MIVKNEMKVLKRCFDSVVDYLDYWVICDTGSTDGTQDFIKSYFKEKNIKGELLEHKWVNFGHNRTKAVQGGYKKADYLILMDADFIFCVKNPNFKKQRLNLESYQIKYEGGLDYRQTLFVTGKKKWRYVGVTHEYITCDSPGPAGMLDAFTFDHLADGGNRSDKFERDIKLLTQGLVDEPTNIRYMFYLAQSHKDLGHWDDAIKYYTMRAKSGGWEEEVYYSLYQLGNCMIQRGDPYEKFRGVLYKAYKFRPSRLEALHKLVNYCRMNNKADDGYRYGVGAINNKYPTGDLLFIEKDIHDWMFLDEVALCACFSNRPFEALKIYKQLLSNNVIPKNQIVRFNANYKVFKEKYEKQLRSEFDNNNNNKNKSDNKNKSEGTKESKNSEITPSRDQVTVILNVYKRINIFEEQLLSIINQSVKPYEIWVCIFNSEYENKFVDIINKYNTSLSNGINIKTIRSDINFKYYGRYQLGIQVQTPYVCYYDDDRFPREDNLKFYLDLVKRDKFKTSILGQWGWVLHKPTYNDGKVVGDWEYYPHYQKSTWITSESNSNNLSNRNNAHLVDYLCGHWFTHKENLYYLFSESPIDFSTGEDMRLSFLSYKYGLIESYCCVPLNDSESIGHNEGNVKGSTDETNLRRRSEMIKSYIEDDYKLVLDRDGKSTFTLSDDNKIDHSNDERRVCFFCPDYTSIGGSELTIKNLYETINKFGNNNDNKNNNNNILITTNSNEMLSFKPDIVITQQHAISFAVDNSIKYGYDVYILLHGPGQFRSNHPRCKLLIYNSDNLLESERRFVGSMNKMVLHPTIDERRVTNDVRSNKDERKYISFIGSSTYNIIKGSDMFVELAKALPNKEFLHVSKYVPFDYDKDTYFGMKIPPPTSNNNDNNINTIKNLKIIDQTEDIASIYNQTRILVVPSIIESFGRVAVEAALNGIPVVTSDIPGLREATFGLAYYVKDYRNVDAFRAAIAGVESNYNYYQERTKEIVSQYKNRQIESINELSSYLFPDIEKKDKNDNKNDGFDDVFYREYLSNDISVEKVYTTNIDKNISSSKLSKEIGIILPTYNRPEYLKLTLESIKMSDLTNSILILVDDYSQDDRTLEMLLDFEIDNVPIIKIFKNKNCNMYHSLKLGWRILKKMGCKYICNIDSDTLVRPDWLKTLKNVYIDYVNDNKTNNKHVLPLVTGFNTTSNNHTNIVETDNYYQKLTVGGINLFFESSYVDIFSRFMTDRMWDYNLSYYCNKNNIPMICTKPSVVQHIGYSGLNANSSNFDYAYDFLIESEFDGEKYYYLAGLDSPGGDIEMMLTTEIDEMAKICNSNINAVGFNSNGWLKAKINPNLREWGLYDVTSFQGTWIKVSCFNNVLQ